MVPHGLVQDCTRTTLTTAGIAAPGGTCDAATAEASAGCLCINAGAIG
jgi:hypothetical protein